MSNFIVSQEDWSLHRKGYEDQKRHQEKIEEVLKENLQDLLTEENIIMPKGNNIIKIPIRSLDGYKIRYNYDKMQHAGMGNGESQIGDIVASDRKKKGSNKSSGAGEQKGKDYYEAEISLQEIEKELFSQLELPNLEQKQAGIIETESYEFNDIGKIGITGNIHKKRTLLQAFKRNSLNGKSSFYPVMPEDLRYRTWNDIKKPDTRAIIIAMMDTSGSMGVWEKYIARSFFFWIKGFLNTKYEKVEIEFIAHHTEAIIVAEHEFFHKGESGGTICSSAYRKALDLIDGKYPPSQYNIYVFHASDGDNLTSDNSRCIRLIDELSNKANMVGYFEVNQYNRYSTLMSAIKNIRNKKFNYFVVKQKQDILYALKSFFKKENDNEQAKL